MNIRRSADPHPPTDRLEVRVHPDGRLEINGMITDAELARLLGPAPLPFA